MTDLTQLSDADLIQLHQQTKAPFEAALAAEGVDGPVADVARSIYQQESASGKNSKTSNAGAVGGMQIVPATFKSVADDGWDINDPYHNARAGIRYIQKMNDLAGGDPALTAVGYYGGPGGLEKARNGVSVADPRNPNAPNTLQYGQQVAQRIPKGPVVQALDKVTDAILPSANAATTETSPFAGMTDDELKAAYEQAKSLQTSDVSPNPSSAGAGRGSVNPPLATDPPKRSMINELGRQLGLTVRAGVSGAAAIPAMMADAVTGPINAGLDAVAGEGNGFRFQPAGQALNNAMTSAGLPQPENATERVVQDVGSSMAGAGSMVKGGIALADTAAGPVVKGVGDLLAAGPGLQLASAATGAGAAGVTRESGGSAGAQVAAGLAGALAPGVVPAAIKATARGVLRGGEAGRQRVADNVATFDQASGSVPTLGQATENRSQQATESLLAKTPGGAGVMVGRAQQQMDDMAASVQRLSDELAPGASAANAGEAIAKGIKGFKEGFKTIQEGLYNTLDQHIPETTPIQVGNTEFALKELNAGIEGAPNISEFFKNAKIKGIDKALQADLDLSSTGGTLPYQAVKKLRTLVGNEIADNSLLSDVPRSKWSALYGALSDDLGTAARQAGPQAEQSWQWANQFTKTQLGRLEQLSGIVAKDSPEKIFGAAISGTSEGDTIVKRVVNALPKQARREIAAAVLQRMGRATPGQQNAMGDAFSSETFLTNVNKLSPAAKETLFGRTGSAGLQDQISAMSQMAENIRKGSKVFANPSGTAQVMTLASVLKAAGLALITGHPATAAVMAASPLVPNAAARFVTWPSVVKFAADKTAFAPGTPAATVEAATRLKGTAQPAPEVPPTAEAPSLSNMTDDELRVAYAETKGAQTEAPPPIDPAAPGSIQPTQEPGVTPDTTNSEPLTAPPVAESQAPASSGSGDGGSTPTQATSEPNPQQPIHDFTSKPLSDGTLSIKGDAQALRDTLLAAGIPARSVVSTANGVMIGRTQAGKVQAAIDRMAQPGSESVAAPAPIDVAAHEAATSHLNDLPQPSPGQQQAGNYTLGHDRIAGMDVSIENPQGSIRRGVDPNGQPWETQMQHHYGYFKGTTAADGHKLDVFIKPGTPRDFNGPVFVIDQVDPQTGKLDEHKAILGATDEADASAIYHANYSTDWQGMGAITRLPLPAFKAWAANGDKRQPLGDLNAANDAAPAIDSTAQISQPQGNVDGTQTAQAQQATQEGSQIPATATDQPATSDGMATAAQASNAVPVQHPELTRIQQLRDAGEHRVADLLQRKYDRNQTLGDVQSELASMQAATPDLPHHGHPVFNDYYQQRRLAGLKPAEASGYAGLLHAVQIEADTIGMPDQAVKALAAKLHEIPIDEAPGFVERFAQGLIERGVMQPFEGSDQIASALEHARDSAMLGAVDSLYGDQHGA